MRFGGTHYLGTVTWCPGTCRESSGNRVPFTVQRIPRDLHSRRARFHLNRTRLHPLRYLRRTFLRAVTYTRVGGDS
ncbi:hypothetical protein EXIGLDRAFT_720223 [Exidia glandulosa HHB12029]|uniref:Uncharacterized protein n=1 Tax=Exidia glandulosa HHB12029 TaxID=1314781 RepID=A0A165GHR8_EXIGL|nr:hypothetical protein EXIGLDRAFT_720223 [Exidia glandulosa HHB12029]